MGLMGSEINFFEQSDLFVQLGERLLELGEVTLDAGVLD
jgi:hypothetical protein